MRRCVCCLLLLLGLVSPTVLALDEESAAQATQAQSEAFGFDDLERIGEAYTGQEDIAGGVDVPGAFRHVGQTAKDNLGQVVKTAVRSCVLLLAVTLLWGLAQGMQAGAGESGGLEAITLAAVLAVALIGGAAVGCTYPGAEATANTLPEIIVTDAVTQEKLPDQVIDYAKEVLTQRMANYEAGWAEIAPDCTITQARLTGLTALETGTARENDGLAAYRLEFRLQVSGNIDAVLVGGINQETVDGQENWIGEYTSAGQPYLVFHWKSQSGSTAWEPLGVFWDDDVSQIVTQEQETQYGNRYTAYLMETYGNQMQ